MSIENGSTIKSPEVEAQPQFKDSRRGSLL